MIYLDHDIRVSKVIDESAVIIMSQSGSIGDIESRKGDHIRLCLDPDSQALYSVFAKYILPYRALPELSLEDIDISYELFGKQLAMPLIIASMTGGSEHGRSINTNLAKAAQSCRVAMGLGSQRIGLEKQDALDTFQLVRELAPGACLIANMGAVQLNYGHGVESYKQIIDMVDADALYLHLNPLQEALQPGGDVNFRGLLEKIAHLISRINVPVLVKEVGHGIDAETATLLFDAGVAGVDVAGVGGTSYAWVESRRAQNTQFESWFKSIGVTTDTAISNISKIKPKDKLLIASGGLRSPVDGLKARALGADMFSAAVPFLNPAIESTEAIIQELENWLNGLKIAMFTCGVKNWDEARSINMYS